MTVTSSALLSPCEAYRYALDRRWAAGPAALFIMLNPSTADAREDDPTIRRCIHFAKREGCGSLTVVNLFAFRASDPKIMAKAPDPVGPGNDDHIVIESVTATGPIIAAWGAHPMAHARAAAVRRMLDLPMRCLGLTKGGAPRHPLYVRGDAPLIPLP